MASAAFTCATVPERVSVAPPFAPPVIAAPPARLTVSVPFATPSVTLIAPPSGSPTESPMIARAVSSSAACGPGTLLTGASLTGVRSRLALPATAAVPSLMV